MMKILKVKKLTMKRQSINLLCMILSVIVMYSFSTSAYSAVSLGNTSPNAADFTSVPPSISDSSDPFVMINLSVELTQQGEAFTGVEDVFPNGTYCKGRYDGWADICYTYKEEYIGYFDSKKCYEYVYRVPANHPDNLQDIAGVKAGTTPNYFKPVYYADNRFECAGDAFSGNFMNWATMTALDEFRAVMTGGTRLVDDAGTNGAQTILTRTHLTQSKSNWPFVWKYINKNQQTDSSGYNYGADYVSQAGKVTPYSNFNWGGTKYNNDGIIVRNELEGNQLLLKTAWWVDISADSRGVNYPLATGHTSPEPFNVAVEVCNPTVGLEANCVEYTDGTNTWYKPEGVLQENALKMRYALTTYSAQSGNARNGGVLRANAKYIGNQRPLLTGGIEANPIAEVNEKGQFIAHADASILDASAGSATEVVNSGVLNYINGFALGGNGYKGNDPVSELYYEGLRYIMNLGRTPEYIDASGSLGALSGSQYDGYPALKAWDDPIVNQCQKNYMISVGDQFSWRDTDLPGTSRVRNDGSAGSNGSSRPGEPSNGKVADVGFSVSTITDNIGTMENMSNLKNRTSFDQNSFYIAGMSHWAATNDIRPDIPGIQTLRTFYVDTQEYKAAGSYKRRNENPLWMTAKYGGFQDSNNDKDPNNGSKPSTLSLAEINELKTLLRKDSTSLTAANKTRMSALRTKCSSTDEWDRDGDCDPDTYVVSSQPKNLAAGIRKAFDEIVEKVSAGSAVGIVSNTADGQGMVVQGLFQPRFTKGDDIFEWGGVIHSVFIDEQGNFREDTDANAQLTNVDYILDFSSEKERAGVVSVEERKGARGVAFRFSVKNVLDENGEPIPTKDSLIDINGNALESADTFNHDTSTLNPALYQVTIDKIKTIWNARDVLAQVTNTNTQRDYTDEATATGGRYIFTAVDSTPEAFDSELGNIVLAEDVIDFTAQTFPNIGAAAPIDPAEDDFTNNFRYLGLDSSNGNKSVDIVNYIRGDDTITGFRSRTIDFDDDGVDEVWRLGDVISSSPAVVAGPNLETRYDLRYNDDTYESFYQKYRDRRQMVYVGANDGMIHAFNAGFFKQGGKKFETTRLGGDFTSHPLGAELWSYVPYNLLPHLRWLTQTEYPHNYYVDGIPQVFDVNIFRNDSDHPGGWGTILVVGFGFGGGDITLDPDSDLDGDTSDDITTRPAYVVLDVTNPEKPPELIAEITHPELGFTTGRPTVVKSRRTVRDNNAFGNGGDAWYLVFGSGPRALNPVDRVEVIDQGVSKTGTGGNDGRIFAFDLANKRFREFGGKEYREVPNTVNGFMGDFVSVDWDNDYADDAVYVGSSANTANDPTGNLWRIKMNMTPTAWVGSVISPFVPQKLLTVNTKPFTGLPHVQKDGNDHWVFTGAGRKIVTADDFSNKQMSYYGIKERLDETKPAGLARTSINESDLANVSDVEVQFVADSLDKLSLVNGAQVYDRSAAPAKVAPTVAGSTVNTFGELTNVVAAKQGWRLDFEQTHARHAGKSDGDGFNVGFTEYIPTADICDPIGDTRLNAVYYKTGTAAPYSGLQLENDSLITGETTAQRSYVFSTGFVRDVNIVNGQTVGNREDGGLDSAKFAKPTIGASRTSWREIQIDW